LQQLPSDSHQYPAAHGQKLICRNWPASKREHFVRFAQAVLYQGAGVDVIWHDLAILAALGVLFPALALSRFKVMLAGQG
jgi:hypothetical protein